MISAWFAALAVDLFLGEPPARAHPTVAMGSVLSALERRAPRDPRAELAYGAVLVGAPIAGALLAGRLVRRVRPWPLRIALELWLLKSSFALRSLLDAGRQIEAALGTDDLPSARARARSLVSRSTERLNDTQLASAAIESLAENLNDSYVAPLLYWRLGGLPLALVYRAVNTADAMIGYRGRYERLGKVAARLDDVAGWLPARLSAATIAVAAGSIGRTGEAFDSARRNHAVTASPNAGWPMAAAAGALGVQLEKPGHYVIGTGRSPGGADIARARRLVAIAAGVATVAIALRGRRR